MCGNRSAIAVLRVSVQTLSVWLGRPYIRSMLVLSKPQLRARRIASKASLAECLRDRD